MFNSYYILVQKMKKLCVIAQLKWFEHAVRQPHKTFSEAFHFGHTIISDLAHLAIFFCYKTLQHGYCQALALTNYHLFLSQRHHSVSEIKSNQRQSVRSSMRITLSGDEAHWGRYMKWNVDGVNSASLGAVMSPFLLFGEWSAAWNARLIREFGLEPHFLGQQSRMKRWKSPFRGSFILAEKGLFSMIFIWFSSKIPRSTKFLQQQ